MKAIVHPDAEKDIAEAAAFYEREGTPALAARFVRESKESLNWCLEHRERTAEGPSRRAFFHTPSSIAKSKIGIYVLVVRRHRRRPAFGAHRQQQRRSKNPGAV